MKLRVMSFNVQHFHPFKASEAWDEIDFRPFADAIRCFAPDVIGINEVRGEGVSPVYGPQAKKIAEMTGYHYYFAPSVDIPDHGLYGNAILCREPLQDTSVIHIPDPEGTTGYFESRGIAKATLPFAGGITMLTTHFGLTPVEAENAVKAVCKEIRASKKPVILTGDFNVTPDNPVLAPIRELLSDTADLFERPLLSYPSDVPTGKIDYIFVSGEWKTLFAHIPGLVLSDHRPYLADLEI